MSGEQDPKPRAEDRRRDGGSRGRRLLRRRIRHRRRRQFDSRSRSCFHEMDFGGLGFRIFASHRRHLLC